MILYNLDDFLPSRDESCLDWLIEQKHSYPNLKVTLFTVPSEWQLDILKQIYVGMGGWIEFAVHGFTHISNDEVLKWDKSRWFEVLNLCERVGVFKKLFKAPDWKMSRLGYQVLKDMGWAVAVRESQIEDVPTGAKYYSFEKQKGIHGHTWLMPSHTKNGLFKSWTKDSKFDFISNNLLTK